CDQCGGRAVTVPQLRRMAGDRFAVQLLRQMRMQPGSVGVTCPFCARPMQRFSLTDPPLELDACRPCLTVWFDVGELPTVPEAPPEHPEMARERLRTREALERLRREEEKHAEADLHSGHYLAMLFGMPVELNAPAPARQPWATLITGLLMVAATVATWLASTDLVATWGLVPNHWWRWGGLTFLTSFFLHGSLLHLASNLYFLLVFGDNVEDFLGRRRWLLLLGGAALAGDVLHILLEPRSEVPCIGASGGISGLITFYALQFPRVRLGLLIYWRLVRIPAWGALVLWALMQGLLLMMQLHGLGDVSAAAHLGGAAAGLAAWYLWKRREPTVDDLVL
ncbi:MAG: rhomboid family intramembrane serine protease, partial [Limisphaera sp.]|nr:rhomboid family intramembrane serine protease [Limisphaera sp.]